MKIGIDAREAARNEKTGKGMWTHRVIEELVKRGIPLTLFLEEGVSKEQLPMLCAESTKIVSFPKGIRWHFAVTTSLRRAPEIDLYLSPTSTIVPRLLGRKFPCAIVIHDLIAFHEEPHDLKAKLIERIMLPKALKTAKQIFTVSEATKRELLYRFPRIEREKILVVYEGPTIENQELRIRNQESLNSYFLIPNSPYVLSIGTLCPRKNQLRLIQAFKMLPENIRKNTKLILVGKRGWEDEEIVRLSSASPNVEWRGYVSEEEREHLLKDATVFAYPSLMEGFGLPVLDALTLGIPTLTSNRSSMPEVAGDGALLVDPYDTESIAKGLERLLADEALRKELVEKGKKQAERFSWGRTVDLLLEGVKQVRHVR